MSQNLVNKYNQKGVYKCVEKNVRQLPILYTIINPLKI